jgi:nucleoside-diphosphate-sugar epimerase
MDYKHTYIDKTVLITGGAGAIGSNLTAALLDAGAKRVIIIDDLSSAERWNVPDRPNVLLVEKSILDEEALKRVSASRL